MVKRNNLTREKKSSNPDKIRDNRFTRGMRKLKFIAAIAAVLNISSPNVSAQTVKDSSKGNIEQVTNDIGSDMVNRISQRTGVKLPDGYEEKFIHFINYCQAFKDEGARNISENFIVEQLENEWVDEDGNVINIEKSDKFLFIVSEMSAVHLGEYIYDGLDGDEQRLENFEISMSRIEAQIQKYMDKVIAYFGNISDEYGERIRKAEEQSAEYDQRIKKAEEQSAEAKENRIKTTYSGLNDMIEFYKIYKRSPEIVKDNEIKQAKEHSKWIISNCEEFGIDYMAFILKEMGGDEKTVNEMLNWYKK